MASSATAKLFKNGRSQAVRLPMEFRFEGTEVRIRKIGKGVLLEPVESDVRAWLAKLAEFNDGPFMPEGRNQPKMPIRKIFKD
ncbi:MAG TPA: type II toxin-antitoxin system VapB family antitoxin [Acidobacteriaceae bacterium]